MPGEHPDPISDCGEQVTIKNRILALSMIARDALTQTSGPLVPS